VSHVTEPAHFRIGSRWWGYLTTCLGSGRDPALKLIPQSGKRFCAEWSQFEPAFSIRQDKLLGRKPGRISHCVVYPEQRVRAQLLLMLFIWSPRLEFPNGAFTVSNLKHVNYSDPV
jgi:hypothetical protein